MTKRIIAIFICFFALQFCFSQENLLPGYIVQLNGDTVKGHIDYRNWEKNPSKVSFTEDVNKTKMRYSPLDIKSFGVQGENYVSAIVQIEVSLTNKTEYIITNLQISNQLTFKTDTAFLQIIYAGEKSLYYYKTNTGKENFYIQQNSVFELLVYKSYMEIADAGSPNADRLVENKKFLGQLAIYLQDCPTISQQLAKTKYSYKSLEKLFDYYFEKTTKRVDFHKDSEKARIEFGILSGVSLSNLKFISNNVYFDYLTKADFSLSTNFSGGLSLDIIPRVHGKWSINNELIYSTYETEGHYEEYIDADRYTIVDSKLGMSHIKLNNMLRYKYPVKNIFMYLNGGFTTGFAIQETNYSKKQTHFFTSDTIKEGKALEETNKIEFGYLLGLGVKVKKFSLEARREAGINGISRSTGISTPLVRYYFFLGYRF